MSREQDLLNRLAKEFASELELKTQDPDYKEILDRTDVIRKLASIMDIPYSEAATQFDKAVNLHRRRSELGL
jgi:hypothetical protein